MLVQSTDAATVRLSATTARHRLFFPAMAALLLALVFLGFAPTYYLRPASSKPLPLYLHLHGAALTLWFSLLLVQSGLIAIRRRSLHRQLGVGGAILGTAIALLTPFVVIWAVPNLRAAGMPIELVTLIVLSDLIALVFFAVLLAVAVYERRVPEAHSRLMLMASILIASPALGRFSLYSTGTPIPGLIVHTLLPFAIVLHDRVMMKRVHPASTWGTLAIVVTLVLGVGLSATSAAQAFVTSLLPAARP